MRAEEAIVLAGGFGTRLRGVVADVPKPLARVAGRPFLAWVLDFLASQGLRRAVLATGYMADKVQAAVGGRWQTMDIAYSVESEPLGTGGALKLAASRLHGAAAHVVNGDTFLRYSLSGLEDAAHAAQVPIAVALAQVPDAARYGAVAVRDGRITAFHEKGGRGPGLVNAGSYYLSAGALQALPVQAAFSFETEVLLPQAAGGRLAAFVQTREFIDIGVPEDFARAQALFAASVPADEEA
ncbi:MAG TPA: nucleotidyltransferase family protein [Steroidobacteraceae bacterium]|nr:nucleotidyltransferase family protein [Steroidobacteraceae bacterium]